MQFSLIILCQRFQLIQRLFEFFLVEIVDLRLTWSCVIDSNGIDSSSWSVRNFIAKAIDKHSACFISLFLFSELFIMFV